MTFYFRRAWANIVDRYRAGHGCRTRSRGGNRWETPSVSPRSTARSLRHESSVFAGPGATSAAIPSRLVGRFHKAAAVCLLAALVDASPSHGQPRRTDTPGCDLRSAGESAVAAVVGPQTLRLADGRTIRLAEIIAIPALPQHAGDAGLDAVSFLRSTLGKKVEVKIGGAERDRYGITTAHLLIMDDPTLWLQEGLVSAGLALAMPQPDNRSCFEALRAAETAAKSARRGNWGTAVFKVLPASDPRLIANLVQTYQIVEGEAKAIARSGARVTLTFGENAGFGFRVYAEGGAAKRLSGDGAALAGKTVRIRGWVERKAGPSITVVLPEQLEVVSGVEGTEHP